MVRKTALTLTALAFIAIAVPFIAPVAHAEQHWQCGDGLSVPLTGSREERDAACRAARRDAQRPPRPLPAERERALRERIEQLEKQYGLEIEAETR